MLSVQEKFDSLKPYVVGIRVFEGVNIVDVVLKNGWTIPKSNSIQMASDTKPNQYLFFSKKKDVGFDELLNFVESIIVLNREKEEKYQLLKSLVHQLKTVFEDNNLSKLKTLKFNFGETNDVDSVDELLNSEPEDKTPKKKQGEGKSKVKDTIVVDSDKVDGNKIELPLNNDPKKVELEDHSLPEHLTEGSCDCGEDDFCPKCMDGKGL
jgi:hypothetical protein